MAFWYTAFRPQQASGLTHQGQTNVHGGAEAGLLLGTGLLLAAVLLPAAVAAQPAAAGATAAPVDSRPQDAARTPAEGEQGDQTPPAGETGELDTLVVRSRPGVALERLKELPKSVSVVTGSELDRLEINDFRDIVTRIGNLGMSNANPQAGSLFIRGLGWAAGTGPLDPSVGVTVDGVSYAINAIASSVNFTDIETFDVTRGPQGTLGGKNTSAGQITIQTRRPSFTPEAEASVGYGRFNNLNTRAAVGGSVIDGLLAWRGTFFREQADGPWKNANDRNFSYKNTDRSYGRAQFLLTPGKDFTALLSLDFTPTSREVSDNYVYFNRPTPQFYDRLGAGGQPVVVNQANEPSGKLTRRWFLQEAGYSYADDFLADEINRLSQQTNNYATKGASANLSWNLSDFTLSSVSAFKDFYFDSGGGPISIFDINRSPSTGHVEYQQLSQELRINSSAGGVLDYQAGLYYLATKTPERWTTTRFGSDAGAYYATVGQYETLDADGDGRVLMGNSLNGLYTKLRDSLDNKSAATYGNVNWHLNEQLTLNTGLRLTWENRQTTSESGVTQQGYGAELNPVAINNVQLGGFSSNPDGSLKDNDNNAARLALADSVALKYFGIASYAGLDDDQRKQVGAAKAIRFARLGTLYQTTKADPFHKLLPTLNVSPSYRFNDRYTGYLSWQHGEKAGIAQIVGATTSGGKSAPVKAEKSDAFELGLKSVLPRQALVVNAALYLQNIRDYIQPMYFYDAAQTQANGTGDAAYTAGLGNVPRVQSKGVEVDALYSGIQYTTLRFAGAYTDATYRDFKLLAKPLELGGPGSGAPYYDATGKTLPGAAKFTANLSAEYARPVLQDKRFHTDVNVRYSSQYNVDPALSRYTVVDAFVLTDVGIGIGRQDRRFDASFIVRNLFNVDYGYLGTWNTFFPSTPRWFGVSLSSKFY